jgi:hypothetical protein
VATEYTTSINTLLKDLIPELPGVVRSVAAREFRLTLRDFFEKTYAWTTTVKDVALPLGETPIQVDDSDANTQVIGVLQVASGEAGSGYVPLRTLPVRPDDETTATDPHSWYVTSNPDEFVLFPYLSAASTKDLTVTIALMPAEGIDAATNTLPRQIISKYYDAIKDGFLARMYAHPNKPYSAPMEAKALRTAYVKARGFYAAQRKSGYNGSQNWSFPRTWGVSKPRS